MRFVLALLLVGCSTTGNTLRTRFAKEHACPEDEVRVAEAGGNQYNVSGCEQRTVYVCGATAGFGNPGAGCAEQGLQRRSPPETGDRPQPPLDPRIQEPPR